MLGLMFLWYSVVIVLCYFPVGEKFAHGITREKLLSLKIGMDNVEIINTIGDPIYIDNASIGNYMVYATPGLLGAGFEINLKLIKNQLYGIYIEEGDLGVYSCDQKRCLGIIKAERFDKLWDKHRGAVGGK